MFSAPHLRTWVPPLYARFQDAIDIVGIATFAGVPAPLRRLVRLSVAQISPKDVFIDWNGAVAADYGVVSGRCHVIVVARSGDVSARAVGPATPSELRRITDAIARDLHSPAPE
jgi:hypothetical protein